MKTAQLVLAALFGASAKQHVTTSHRTAFQCQYAAKSIDCYQNELLDISIDVAGLSKCEAFAKDAEKSAMVVEQKEYKDAVIQEAGMAVASTEAFQGLFGAVMECVPQGPGPLPDTCAFGKELMALQEAVMGVQMSAMLCAQEAEGNGVEPTEANGMVASTSINDDTVKAFDASFANAKAAVATLLTAQYKDSGHTFQTGFQALKETDEFKNLANVVKAEMGPEEAQLKEDVAGLWGCVKGTVTMNDWVNGTAFISTIADLEPLAEQYLSGDIYAIVNLIDYLSK